MLWSPSLTAFRCDYLDPASTFRPIDNLPKRLSHELTPEHTVPLRRSSKTASFTLLANHTLGSTFPP